MMLFLWWICHRLAWSLQALTPATAERDRILAERAARILNRHWKEISPASSFDPYSARPMMAVSQRDARLMHLGRVRAMATLQRGGHSLAGHLMNALLRERDQRGREQAK